MAFLTAIDDQDLDENETLDVSAAVLEEKFEKEKRRSWTESRKLKLAKKTDREFFERRKTTKPGFRKIGDRDFRERSRCANCGEKGHWVDQCKNPCAS
eukprot:3022617-Pyramimonas_sp.AAC.1